MKPLSTWDVQGILIMSIGNRYSPCDVCPLNITQDGIEQEEELDLRVGDV